MKAIRIHEHARDAKLYRDEIDPPKAGANEVLIRVKATALNPIDVKFATGAELEMKLFNIKAPFILGGDISGVVEDVGVAVTRFRPGDAVFARNEHGLGGGLAELIAIRSDYVAHAPKTVGFPEAAGMPGAAGTAWTVLFDIAKLQPGQAVLVHAAAGGVGGFTVQLAKLAGAKVIATASKGKHELLKSLGADVIIDYQAVDFRTQASDVDVVIDLVGHETEVKSYDVLKPGGLMVCCIAPPNQSLAAAKGVRAVHAIHAMQGACLEDLAGLVDAGKLKVTIDSIYPPDEAEAAFARVASGHAAGKVIVQPM
jgi:NADPH:quinone reductase-like Zn-dependent oxidoreductase